METSLKKSIITILSILFILFFILWASGCHLWEASQYLEHSDQKPGQSLSGCFDTATSQGMLEIRTNTDKMRQYMEKRTGQSFEGWTLYEMQLMEMELDRLEKEKKDSALAAQEPFINDEDPHKKDPADRNAPSGGYTDKEYEYDTETDETYTEEQTANKSLDGRWQHPDGDIIEISGSTGIFIAFSPVWQNFADHDFISLGMPAYQNIVSVTDISQILEVNKYPDPADDITANAENFIEFFEGFDYLWRCSVLYPIIWGDTGEPHMTQWDDDAILVMSLDGESFMQYGMARRKLEVMQKYYTYYRIK